MRLGWKPPPKLLGLAALTALLFSAQPASAQTTLTAGNVPQAGDENILLNTGQTGFSVTGTSNQTAFQVNFTNSAGELDDTRVEVTLERIALFAGVTWAATPQLAVSGEAYAVPADAASFRLAARYTLGAETP